MSISYELAKELKDAGFPQDGNNRDAMGAPIDAGNFGTGFAYVPTLEELIEACGEDFDLLTHDKNRSFKNRFHEKHKWWATSWSREEAGGASAIEAVARLWLALRHATMKSI